MPLDRRCFLRSLCGTAAASLWRCSQPDLAPEPPAAAHAFVPYVVGANTAITGWGFFEVAALLADIGYRSVEVQNLSGKLDPVEGEFPGFTYDKISEEDKERILAALKPFDHLTAHLPYAADMNYIAPAADEAVSRLGNAMDAAEFLGAKLAVLHPQPSGADLYANWDLAVSRIREWGSIAADKGFRIAFETAMPNSVPDLVRFQEEIGHDNVGVTLDVGHQARFKELAHVEPEERGSPQAVQAYNDLNLRIVEALGGKLFHVHTNDIEPDTWAEHKPLIHGFIDYPRLIAKLRETRFGGVLMFEIGGDAEKMPGWLREGKSKMDAFVGA